jgi:ectoine hydroxylase-related dioxygenase (phytanoyl-CoA dioxygenase family)
MADPKAPHPDEQLVLAPAGTVVVFNSHAWHGGTLNRSSSPRRAVHSYWTRRDQPQQLDQRKFLSAETKQSLPPVLRYLLDVE